MGVVYLARHVQLGRTVALKMILAGSFAAPADVRRFLAEAAAVAHLQHPNIVQLFESGERNGLPFFALEYVDGGSLADLVRTAPLPAARAAQVVEQLAQGMASAHSRGVVHRDLKPENVLLTANGTAKIADFGLAKRVEAGSSLTNTGVIVGTPAYMAPEQASGESKAAGPAADVYALGAILYRVLTGRPPFQAATALETVMQVRHSEPVPPTQLQPSVPRDLETICLKCLQKEPDKRYASALALAEDLQRFWRHEPILARPVGRWERLLKWAKRRPAVASLSASLLALTLLVIAGLLIGIGLISDALTTAETERDAKEEQRQRAVEAARAESQAKIAETEANKALEKRLAQLTKAQEILKSIFGDLDLRRAEKDDPPVLVKLGEHLDKAAKLLEEEAVGAPVDVAELQLWLGTTQVSLGNFKSAVGLLSKARRTFERERGPDHSDTLASIGSLASAYQFDGQLKEALPLHERTLAKRKLTLGPDHPATLASMNNLAVAYQADGQLKRALPLFELTLMKSRLALGSDHRETLASMNNLARAYEADGQLEKALPLLEETLEKRKAKLAPDNPQILRSMNNLAAAYHAVGQIKKALPLLEETLAKRKLALGPDHSETLTSMNNLATAYQADGQLEKALPLLEETLAKLKVKLGPDHRHTLLSMINLGDAYEAAAKSAMQEKKYAAAEVLLRDCLKLRRQVLPNAWTTFHTQSLIGGSLLGQKKLAEAQPLLLEGYEGMQQRASQIPAAAKFRLVEAAQCLVDLYVAGDRPDQAAIWRKTVAAERAWLPPKAR
jgi:serine/threonine-protein kinase